MELLYASGIRAGEAQALDLADLALENEEVRVRHGKGDSERIALVGRAAIEAMRAYLNDGRPVLAAHNVGKPDPGVFLNKFGKRLSDRGIRRTFESISAGLRTPQDDAAHAAPLLRHASPR